MTSCKKMSGCGSLFALGLLATAVRLSQAQFSPQSAAQSIPQSLPQTPQFPSLPQTQSTQSSETPQQPQVNPQTYPQQFVIPSNLPQNDIINRCRQSTFATEADVLTVLQLQNVPYTTTGQCMLACSAQQLGLVPVGLPLELQGAGVLTRTLFPARGNDYLFQNELLNAVNSCSNVATQLAGVQLAQTGLQTLNSFRQLQLG